MATDAQIHANQLNARHSTGPTTEPGRAASCKNNFRYGLTGSSFTVLDFEDQDEYDHVLCGLRFEHQPSTITEAILVEKMAQSYWLSKRALYLHQNACLCGGPKSRSQAKPEINALARSFLQIFAVNTTR